MKDTETKNKLLLQELVLQPGHIPRESTEIFITGGRTITFSPKTFNNLQALALLRLDGVKNVVLASKSFYNIHALSLLVQVLNCDDLLFDSHAFEDMQVCPNCIVMIGCLMFLLYRGLCLLK